MLRKKIQNNSHILYVLLILILVILVFIAFSKYYVIRPKDITIPEKSAPNNPESSSTYFYPILKYSERVTFREFGKSVNAADKAPRCGKQFEGIHNADDLEVFENEINQMVSVYSLTKAKVVDVGSFGGYGGLIILSSKIENEDVTIYYGHIDVNTAKVKKDDDVSPGQELAYLAKDCSLEADGERQHLHFSIHKGNEVDIRGYVQSSEELEEWLNPKEKLKSIMANNM